MTDDTHVPAPGPGVVTEALLLSFYYLPDNTSGVQRAVRLSKYLPRNGISVHVVCSGHKGNSPELKQVTHVPSPDTRRNWSTGPLHALFRGLQRILPYNEQLRWVPHAIAAAGFLIRKRLIPVVISTSPPLATHFTALWLKARYRVRWVADFRDPLAGNPNRSRRWARPYDVFWERTFFRFADVIIAVTDTVADNWKAQYPQWSHKIHVVWNGFDPEESVCHRAIPPRNFRLLCHVGLLYPARRPMSILGSVLRLVERNLLSPATFRIRLTGPVLEPESFALDPLVMKLVKIGCLDIQDTLIPRVASFEEMAEADCLLLLDIVNSSGIGYTVPAKLYDYVLAARPILAVTDHGSPVERILAKCGLPYTCVYHDDIDDVVDRKLLERLSVQGGSLQPSKWFTDTFDGSRQAATIASLINRVLSPSK